MAKIFSSRFFEITPELKILCTCEDTRYGFRHLAQVYRGGWSGREKPVKACYYNRTWESFEFETVLHLLADKYPGLSDAERQAIREIKR